MKFLFKLIVISIIVILLTETTNEILDINALLYNSFAEQFTKSQIENFFLYRKMEIHKLCWRTYISHA